MTVQEVIVRLGAAVVAGSIIGLNRDLRGKPAGLRTHSLVTLGAALVTVVAVDIATAGQAGESANAAEIMRAVQGIITGIGFIGGGVILHPDGGRNVRGLTTAASIWVAAALGIACGAGRWVPALAGIGLTLIVLIAGGPVERLFHRIMGREPQHGGRELNDAEQGEAPSPSRR